MWTENRAVVGIPFPNEGFANGKFNSQAERKSARGKMFSIKEKDISRKEFPFRSTGQRNTLIEHFCWRTEVQRLARTLVHSKSDPVQVRLGVIG